MSKASKVALSTSLGGVLLAANHSRRHGCSKCVAACPLNIRAPGPAAHSLPHWRRPLCQRRRAVTSRQNLIDAGAL